MINTILFVGSLCAMFLYAMVVKLEPTVRPVPTEAPVVQVAPSEPAPIETAVVQTKAAVPVIDLEKGRKLFMVNCISCHNKDPNKKGAIGPELTDAPLEVMKVKVVTGRYPEVLPAGFVAKRKTKQMKKFPQLEADVPSLHAWIQSMKTK